MPSSFDFTRVVLKKRNMLDCVGTVAWNSYTMHLATLAEALLAQVSQDAIAVKHPTHLKLEQMDSEPRAIMAFPVTGEGPDTVPLKYFERARMVHVDLWRLFSVQPLPIPQGNRAQIPISRLDLPDRGPCLVLHFGKAEMKEITRRKGNGMNQIAAGAVTSPQ